MLLGALTGRDGIGGASVLASAELGESDEAKRPSVQIGDPFTEKKLLECCLELLDRELLVSLQDLGAAGLTSAASEMASKGGVGIDIDVSRVPLREPGMEPFEVMISESQERMLCVVTPERVARRARRVRALGGAGDADRHASPTGRCLARARPRATCVADLPVSVLVDDCPLYDLEPGARGTRLYAAPAGRSSAATSPPAETLLALLRSPNIASRRPVFEQYDPIVAVAHRPPARRGGRGCAGAAGRLRDRGLDRRQRHDAWRATRASARPRPCTSARPTWRVSGAEPLG